MTDISKGRLTLFLISKLLIICLSTCYVVKRNAPDGQLYVFSDRGVCESVQSQAPCTLSWELNSYLAKVYKQHNEIVATVIQQYKNHGYSNGCVQALENSLCSQVVPKCSAVDGTRDYGDVSKLCNNLYLSCPQTLVDVLKRTGFCQSLKKGKHPNSACVTPSTPITGACPQPKFKMPLEFLDAYKKQSARLVQVYNDLKDLTYDNGERMYPDECISQLEEISCSPLYCSANESQLLIKHDREDCNKIINDCFDEPLTRLAEHASLRGSTVNNLRSQLQSQCDNYPKSSTNLQTEPALITLKPVTDPPQQPDITKQPRNPQQHQKKRHPNSAGNCQFAHPILLAAMSYFFIKTYL